MANPIAKLPFLGTFLQLFDTICPICIYQDRKNGGLFVFVFIRGAKRHYLALTGLLKKKRLQALNTPKQGNRPMACPPALGANTQPLQAVLQANFAVFRWKVLRSTQSAPQSAPEHHKTAQKVLRSKQKRAVLLRSGPVFRNVFRSSKCQNSALRALDELIGGTI